MVLTDLVFAAGRDCAGGLAALTVRGVLWAALREPIVQFLLLGGAGHETVMKTISNGAVALWWYKDQRRELAADPRLIPAAVEEMLRWDNPAPLEGRQTTREVTLHGVTIPEDSRVMINMGAANHDERQYELPELFNIHRKMERSLIFGFGVHLCLGAHPPESTRPLLERSHGSPAEIGDAGDRQRGRVPRAPSRAHWNDSCSKAREAASWIGERRAPGRTGAHR